MALKDGKYNINQRAGGAGYFLWYQSVHKERQGIRDKNAHYAPYPSLAHNCRNCGEEFLIYKYPGVKWSKIHYCSLDCCWLHKYNKKFPTEDELKAAAQKPKGKNIKGVGIITCEACGNQFKRKRVAQKYCTSACFQESRKEKKQLVAQTKNLSSLVPIG